MIKTTVIYHSADFDGIFCREIAKKFLPDAEFIGWDYGDATIPFPSEGTVYLMDLSPDCFGEIFVFGARKLERLIWIDHHKTAIENYPKSIPGYRIDGVAACRLAYHWFTCSKGAHADGTLAEKEDFVIRRVHEPLAVRLVGEYDIWDKRDPRAELFQFGLRSCNLEPYFRDLLELSHKSTVDEIGALADAGHTNLLEPDGTMAPPLIWSLLQHGETLQYARGEEYREVITAQGFDVVLEGYTYLACNSHELDIRSQLFDAGIKPHHEGLLGFTFNGKDWRVSLYGIPGQDIDHSLIAVKYGGGGHKNACGFRSKTLSFFPCS